MPSSLTLDSPSSRHDPYIALRYPGYRSYMLARSFFFLAVQMQIIAVTWEIYQRLHNDLRQAALGMGCIGLVQFLPIILLALPAGQLADRFSRRKIVMTTQCFYAFWAISFYFISKYNFPLYWFYVFLFLTAISRAFTIPAVTSLYTALIPWEAVPNAAVWNSTAFQLSALVGPSLAGGIISIFSAYGSVHEGPQLIFVVNVVLLTCGFLLFSWSTPITKEDRKAPITWDTLLSGVKFVFGTRILLGLILLDLFSVFLGGATALLPIFASDILQVGALGYGILRAAPALGAVLMAVSITQIKPWKHAGRAMLWACCGFGVATLVFGLSKSFVLSLLALAVTGACDNISVVVRQTLMQMITPEQMRGRVSSVAFIFISCSNELGELESGFTARWMGAIGSVIFGGIGTILTVGASAMLFPELLRLGPLNTLEQVEVAAETDEELQEQGN